MKARYLILLLTGLVAVAFLAGAWYGQRKTAPLTGPGGRKILHYVDPMNPAHTSDKPGLAPCGMKMEPVYADEDPPPAGGEPMPAGTVRVSPEKQQLIGVRLGKVERKPLSHVRRLPGRVAVDERRLYLVTAPGEGWVTKAMPLVIGSRVRHEETLAEFYSPVFYSAAQALINALDYADRVKAAGQAEEQMRGALPQVQVKQYSESLKSLGMAERQIEELIRSRKFTESIHLVAPADGFVVLRNCSQGQRFEKGTELYRVADLSTVWILADFAESDAGAIEPGFEVRVAVPRQDRVFHARVCQTLPQFDAEARRLRVRFEAENPDFTLKPDMLVDVDWPVAHPEGLVVPADAVLDAGLKQTVFVDRGNGYFEPRPVIIGKRLGEHIEILKGLTNGEPIVVSGNFLLDSESRMKLAAAGLHGAIARDPVCKMDVDEQKAAAAGRKSTHAGRAYYFCCDMCRQRFEKEPERFLKKPEGSNAPAAGMKPEAAPSTTPSAHH